MIIQSDIHPDWSAEDIALFAATVGAVQKAIKHTAIQHGRQEDPILELVTRATLVAIKSMMIETGLRTDGSSILAFRAWGELMAKEAANAPVQCKQFENDLTYHGRA